MEVREILIYLALKYKGNYKDIHKAIVEKEPIDESVAEHLLKEANCNVITLLDEEYPEGLKSITYPPFCLFYYGDINLLKSNNILGVVGSRDASSYGLSGCKNIVAGFKDHDYVIVSGMARGIDEEAHKTCLDNNIKTIAVLGTGLDVIYPVENTSLYYEIKRNGLLISEYPFNTVVEHEAFTFRNRIISGISKGIFIPEVQNKSGTIVTLRYSLEQGKEVFVLPQPYFEDKLNNHLIREGARLVTSAKEIIEDFE